MNLITIKTKNIPTFLQYSELFVENKESENITIEKQYLIEKINLSDINDFKSLVKILYYWDISRVPHAIYNFIESNPEFKYESILDELTEKFSDESTPKKKRRKVNNFIEKIKLFLTTEESNLIAAAISNGFLDVIVYKHHQFLENVKNDINLQSIWHSFHCEYAAQNGHLHILKYLHDNGCPWDSETVKNAAWFGKDDCLQYALENNCPKINATCQAVRSKNFKCLQLLHQYECEWEYDTAELAAFYNRIDMLKFVIENGCPFSTETLNWAASNGSLKSIEYLLSLGVKPNKQTLCEAQRCWNMYGNPQIKHKEAFKEIQDVRTKCLELIKEHLRNQTST